MGKTKSITTAVVGLIILVLMPWLTGCAGNAESSQTATQTTVPTASAYTIKSFWNTFELCESNYEWGKTPSDMDSLLVTTALAKINPDISIECSLQGAENILVITADGDSSLFPVVDAVVAQAPEIPAWKILALRPPKDFTAAATWRDYTVNLTDVYFKPIDAADGSFTGIEFVVRGLSKDDTASCYLALKSASETALGERRYVQAMKTTLIISMPADADISKYTPMTALDSYLTSIGR